MALSRPVEKRPEAPLVLFSPKTFDLFLVCEIRPCANFRQGFVCAGPNNELIRITLPPPLIMTWEEDRQRTDHTLDQVSSSS